MTAQGGYVTLAIANLWSPNCAQLYSLHTNRHLYPSQHEPAMAASPSSRHHHSRRDRGGSRRDRDRDDSIDLYDDEPRGRDKRPAASRRSTYNDGDGSAEYYYDDEDRHYPPRSSDHKSRRQTRGGGRRHHSEPRSSSTRGSHDDRRERDRSVDNKKKRNQMIKAGLSAAAVEAFRQKNRPGDWVGAKGVRVATAAISAAVIDAGIDKNPNRGAMGNILKSTIGGLVFDKIAHGGKR